MLFEEMGYDLEDVSNVEIQIESCLNHVLTKITRSTRSTRNCMCNLWWRRDDDEQLPVLCGLLQQGKRNPVVLHKCYRREMIGAVLMWEEFLGSNVDCYMKTSPQLFCADITRGEDSCNLWWGKEFLGSNVDFYIRTTSFLLCTDVTKEEN